MDLPTYLRSSDDVNLEQENYHEELSQTLRQNLGANGFSISQILSADLSFSPILDPNSGQFTTVKDLAPVGTEWWVLDANPPGAVKKIATNPTVLARVLTAPYP